MKIRIAPSLLAAHFLVLKDEIKKIEDAGADVLHLDVMDGQFVPPISFGQDIIAAVRDATSLHLDVHLMIERPDHHVLSFAAAGADTVTFHIEATAHAHRLVQQLHSEGVRAGIAINPATPVETIKQLLNDIDQVLVMTVNPGYGGQRFVSHCVEKIQVLSQLKAKKYDFDIQVDGGINSETGTLCVQAGANILVAGTYIFKSSNYQQAIQALRLS